MSNVLTIVEAFLAPTTKKKVFGNYRIEGNTLLYRATDEDQSEEVLAIKTPSGAIVGNSTQLRLVGRTMAWGRDHNPRGEKPIQRALASKIPMLPFTVFTQAGLDLNNLRVIDQGGAEVAKNLERQYNRYTGNYDTRTITVHFTGASLFEIDGQQFLFDIDRREQEHAIFNPFLVKLPTLVTSIAEAYQVLKPQAVVDAERAGHEVLRQGEWFFIPTAAPALPELSEQDKLMVFVGASSFDTEVRFATNVFGEEFVKQAQVKAAAIRASLPQQLTLQAGENRPNTAERGVKRGDDTLVTGKISHTGREHADLVLDGWYIAVPNTATTSWTITGDID